MLTMPSRRLHWPAAVALALVVGLPAIADAQLFPNLAIRRKRTPCCNEEPGFKMYRQQYYGYHPTCWRRFPDGWGCPSPELPNTAQAMQDIQAEIKRLQQNPPPETGEMPGPGAPETTPRTQPDTTIPELPQRDRERAPFNLDNRPFMNPPPSDTTPPPGSTPRGAGVLEAPPETPSTSNTSTSGAPLTLLDVGNPSMPPPPSTASAGTSGATDDLPWPAPPTTSDPIPSSALATTPLPYSSPATVAAPYPGPAPGSLNQPPLVPQRRSILSGLLQNWNVRRR